MPFPRASLAAVAVAAASLSLLAAGCGGGGGSPSVASLGSTGATSTAGSAGASSGGSAPGAPSGGGGAVGFAVQAQTGRRFADCMRKHGVPDFPDPGSKGAISVGPGSGIDPSSPSFRKALQLCRQMLPNGGRPTPQQLAKMQAAALAFSACMRAHGIKDFPDPQFSGDGVRMALRAGGDLDPRSPAFQRAQQACQGELPVKTAPGAASQGGP